MAQNEKRKHRVALKNYTNKNLLAISAWIEEENKMGTIYFSDVIFIELTEEYDAGKKESMLIDATELRKMNHAVRELLRTGETSYEKWTDPTLAGGTGPKKKLSFMKSDDGNYFLNLTVGSKKLRFIFEKYSMIAFAESILLVAEEAEKILYYFQRR